MVSLHIEQQEDTSSHTATSHKPSSSTSCWSVSLSQWQSLLSAQPSLAGWGKSLVSFPPALASTQMGERSCGCPAYA